MTLSVKHAFTSAKAASSDSTIVDGPKWNDEHALTAALNKILGTTGASTTVTELSVSDILDLIGSTQGQILYRGASAWAALSPGTSGFVLTSGGAGANPSWAVGGVVDADYLVRTAHSTLTAERVVTDTARIVWDWGTPGLVTADIPVNAIGDLRLRDSAALSVIGRSANSTGDPADIAAVAASGAVLRESGGVLGFGTIVTAGLADDAATDAKLRNSAAVSVIGRAANSSGDPADIAAAANDRILARISDALSFAQLTVGMAPDDLWTYAKIQNVSATDRILGRDTAGAGDIEELTLSQVLDFIGSAAQGDILYRGAATWARLGAGTSGHFLQTQGAGANPQWAASTGGGLVLLTSGTVSGAATLDIVLTSHTAYRGIVFELSAFIPVTDGVTLLMRVSTDGGSSYDAAGYNWSLIHAGDTAASPAAVNNGSDTSISITNTSAVGNVSTEGYNGTIKLLSQTSTAIWSRVFHQGYYIDNTATPRGVTVSGGGARETAQDTDAVRFLFSSGNISSGNYAVYGLA